MVIFSTHLLNSVNGTHAANVKIIIYKIHEDKRNIFIEGETDNSGRMQNEFELTKEDCESNYEMIIESGNYFNDTSEIVNEISVKFNMKDPKKKNIIYPLLYPQMAILFGGQNKNE